MVGRYSQRYDTARPPSAEEPSRPLPASSAAPDAPTAPAETLKALAW